MGSRSLAALLLCLPGCTGASHRTVAALEAPPSAEWGKAELVTFVEKSQGGGGHGFGPTTYEMGALELQLTEGGERRSLALESTFEDAPFFWERSSAKEATTGTFSLAASPDGAWLGVSRDGGKSWRLIEPRSLLSCRHLVVPGPVATLWARAPTPQQVSLDVLATELLEEPGPLGLPHPHRGDDGWTEHLPPTELALAVGWAAEHPADPVVQRAAARALVALPDSIVSEVADPLVQLTTASAGSNPEVRALLEAEFDRVRPGHFSGPAAAAEALLEVPGVELQADLSRWLEAVLARGPAQLTADLAKVANSDWALTRVVWNLARLAYRDGHSSAAATHAALGVLGFLSVGLGTPEETAQRLKWSKVKDDPWAFAGSPAQATATYAVQIVAASTEPGAKEALEALRWARDAEPFDAQPTFKDPVRDHRGPNDVSRVSGWMGWAVKRLSRAP